MRPYFRIWFNIESPRIKAYKWPLAVSYPCIGTLVRKCCGSAIGDGMPPLDYVLETGKTEREPEKLQKMGAMERRRETRAIRGVCALKH